MTASPFQYRWHDRAGSWLRRYGNERWEFSSDGLMKGRDASINEVAIAVSDRRCFAPRRDYERAWTSRTSSRPCGQPVVASSEPEQAPKADATLDHQDRVFPGQGPRRRSGRTGPSGQVKPTEPGPARTSPKPACYHRGRCRSGSAAEQPQTPRRRGLFDPAVLDTSSQCV
jgi:hypothetical protein